MKNDGILHVAEYGYGFGYRKVTCKWCKKTTRVTGEHRYRRNNFIFCSYGCMRQYDAHMKTKVVNNGKTTTGWKGRWSCINYINENKRRMQNYLNDGKLDQAEKCEQNIKFAEEWLATFMNKEKENENEH